MEIYIFLTHSLLTTQFNLQKIYISHHPQFTDYASLIYEKYIFLLPLSLLSYTVQSMRNIYFSHPQFTNFTVQSVEIYISLTSYFTDYTVQSVEIYIFLTPNITNYAIQSMEIYISLTLSSLTTLFNLQKYIFLSLLVHKLYCSIYRNLYLSHPQFTDYTIQSIEIYISLIPSSLTILFNLKIYISLTPSSLTTLFNLWKYIFLTPSSLNTLFNLWKYIFFSHLVY